MIGPVLSSSWACGIGRRIGLATLAAAALLASPGPGRAEEATRTLVWDGVERSYTVVDPKPGAPKPLVMMLHGGGGDARRVRRVGFEALGAREGFVTVYPEGRGGGWMDGRGDRVIVERSGAVDDVGFLTAVIDRLVAEGRADPKRVYLVGVSNGGMMTLRMICERADRLAGAVTVVALMPEALESACRPAGPVPILMMVGTEDRFIPLGGGAVAGFLGQARGAVVSLDRTLAVLRAANGCRGEPARRELPDAAPDDGVRTVELAWLDCRGRGRLVVLSMQGAGHGWPGRPTPASGTRLDEFRGGVTRDFDGADAAWRFLAPLAR